MTPAPLLPMAPGPAPARGLYVHIPFCLARCDYCDFNAYAGMEELRNPYVEALMREITSAADGGEVSTIFFGGGTPTILPPTDLARILAAIHESFQVAPSAEITIEANPETVDERSLSALRTAGFNRLSVGVQSTAPHVLTRLGRIHSPQRALATLRAAHRAGFDRINADLIYGTPGESESDWRRSLESIIESGVDHISAYALTIEEATPLSSKINRGEEIPPEDDDQATKFEIACDLLASADFTRYEISNWAKNNSWCRHNLTYWCANNYLGFGAGAHSHHNGRRAHNIRSPRTYIENSPSPEAGFEVLSPNERIEEAIMLALRLTGGINRPLFQQRWKVDPLNAREAAAQRLQTLGFLELSPHSMRLTDRAAFLTSAITTNLLSETAA
jgi:putative oxygen-independent coproporphyrinogen III oxidase